MMANLTERVCFTVPADVKASWQAEAKVRGMTLSAFLRRATDDVLICYELEVLQAQLESKRLGATIQ